MDLDTLLSKYSDYTIDGWGGTDHIGLTGDTLKSHCFSWLVSCKEESTEEDIPLTETLDGLFTVDEAQFLWETLGPST